jgi:O-Antigen ligase
VNTAIQPLLVILPIVVGTNVIWQGAPLYAHPVLFISALIWGACIILVLKNLLRDFQFGPLPWSAILLGVMLLANALPLGNSYGLSKVGTWIASSLPLLIWPSLVAIQSKHLVSLAFGQLLAGFIVLPTLLTLNPHFYGEITYIWTALYGGLAVVSGMMLGQLYRRGYFRPFVIIGVAGAVLIAAAGVVLSGARGALIAAVFALGVIPLLYPGRAALRLTLLTGGAIVLVAAIPEIVGTLSERIKDDTLLLAFALRFSFILNALESFLSNPLSGIGAGRFAEVHIMPGEEMYPHNFIMEIAAEFGFLPLILILYVLAIGIRGLWGLRHEDRAACALGMASFVFLFANAMKMGDLSSHRMLCLWIGIGIACKLRQSRQAERDRIIPSLSRN